MINYSLEKFWSLFHWIETYSLTEYYFPINEKTIFRYVFIELLCATSIVVKKFCLSILRLQYFILKNLCSSTTDLIIHSFLMTIKKFFSFFFESFWNSSHEKLFKILSFRGTAFPKFSLIFNFFVFIHSYEKLISWQKST